MKKLPRKRRTRDHVIADLSVNHVERHALLCGFVVERVVHDYGIDLELFTFNRVGEIEEGHVLLQLKASDRFEIRAGQATFAFRIERGDLVLWLAQPAEGLQPLRRGPDGDGAYPGRKCRHNVGHAALRAVPGSRARTDEEGDA
jgi:hypothetical protein